METRVKGQVCVITAAFHCARQSGFGVKNSTEVSGTKIITFFGGSQNIQSSRGGAKHTAVCRLIPRALRSGREQISCEFPAAQTKKKEDKSAECPQLSKADSCYFQAAYTPTSFRSCD